METVGLVKCEGCEKGPCLKCRGGRFDCANSALFIWKDVTATIHPQPEPEKELGFEFGDRVEVYDDGFKKWFLGKYACFTGSYHQVLIDGRREVQSWLKVRRPLRERMRKGQLVFFGPDSKHRIFKSFTGENCISVFGGEFGTIWRLPTQSELDEIGHGSGGWLTSDGGE